MASYAMYITLRPWPISLAVNNESVNNNNYYCTRQVTAVDLQVKLRRSNVYSLVNNVAINITTIITTGGD